ncbi:MAG: hypothetical protein JWN04_3654, partial [Myxococcaceae bacterium]|nr:hypothetical protein [Myxococcaceae bacterium]
MGDEGGAGAKPGSAAPEPSDGDPTAGEDDDNRAHAIELYDDRHSLEGKIRPDLQNAAWKQFSEMGTLTNQLASGLPFARWVPLGPGPSLTLQGSQGYRLEGGTVWDIAIDPAVGADGAADQVMYLATEGGIWKTLDGGASWLPKTSRLGVQWFGAVALDVADTNTVYAGSGSTYHALGNGLYKSSDGGSHWKGPFAQAELTGKAVTRIVSPARNVLLVSARDDRNQAGLLLRSTDGGETFVRVSIPFFPSSSCPISDLHLSTASSDEVFVAIHGKGIFRSTDAGASFTSNLFSGSGAPEPDTYRWVTFAQGGRANSAVFYAAVAVQVGMQGEPKRKDDVVLYKSNDAGGSWSKLSNFKGDIPWFQSGHAQTIGVDPDDVNNVFVGLESAFVSADGGQTFTVIRESELHPDHHAITYSPTRGRSGRALYVGTDGGLSRRAHGSDTWTGLNDGLTNSLINDLDIGRGSEANRAYSYAGFQDQGTQVMKPGFALPRWQKIDGGDNAFVAVDPSDPRHALTSAGFKRTTDGSTLTSRAAALKGNPVLLRFDPNVVADVDHKRLYMSAQGHGSGLYATNDSAATVT